MHLRLRLRLKSFASDRRGNIAIMSALFMTVIMGFAALGVDMGKVYTDRRKAQSAVDLAALSAANDIEHAARAAMATIKRNNYDADTPVKVELGTYVADGALAPQARFTPAGAANANAARVTLNTRSFLLFGKVVTGKSAFDVTTQAIATRAAFASFAIGSRLAKLDAGLLNQLLGGLLGTGISLSVMDYQALIDARLDLFDFMNALSTRLDIKGLSYDQLLKMNVKASDVLAAMSDVSKAAYGANNAGVKALSGIAQSLKGSSDKLLLQSLLDVGTYGAMPLGQKPRIGVSVAALDFLSATGQLASGQRQIDIGLKINIPGIANASLRLAVGERPKGTSWVTIGGEGASVHTAQTRLLLTSQLIGSGPASIVNLPLYIELASATARLSALKCAFPDANASSATLSVTPALVDAWIGDVSVREFNNFRSPPNPGEAMLVNTLLLTVSGRAHATVSNMSATPVTFSMGDIEQRAKKTVGTRDFTASLLSRLVRDTQLDVNVIGLGIGLPGPIRTLVANILAGAVSPLDQLLGGVLQTIGLGLGQADVWVMGLRCDGAVLVN